MPAVLYSITTIICHYCVYVHLCASSYFNAGVCSKDDEI